MGTRTIIFDLGKTLVPFDLERLEPRMRAHRPEATWWCGQAETGAATPERFQAEMCRLTGLAANGFDAWWNSIFERRWLLPEEWIRQLLVRYRVGLLSNTNALHFAYLRRHWPLLEAFHFHILSHEVGAAKPTARIYEAAEAAAGCAPEEIFYLDDIPAFVEAARERGWRAATFTGAGELVETLEQHGIQAAEELRAMAVGRPSSRQNANPAAPGS